MGNNDTLNYKSFGQGDPVVILHGLLGSLDNWQTIARQLAEDYTVFIVDQRNHGKSFHSDTMNYKAMAEDLANFLDEQGVHRVSLVGHSMGGKTAMKFAGSYPNILDKLVVVDIGPKAYPPGHDNILDALQALPVGRIESRTEADDLLAEHISDQGVRMFLLKNLARDGDGYKWKMNLPAIVNHYDEITEAVYPSQPHEGPSLFIKGEKSDYIQDEDWTKIQEHFPAATLKSIDNAGHWVHADQPEAMLEALRDFLHGA